MPIDTKLLIENYLEEALIEISKDEVRVNKALLAFEKLKEKYFGKIEEMVFNSWLLHYYSDSKGAVIDIVDGDDDLVQSIKTSTLGFFSVHKDKKYFVFQDILTKKQYVVNEDDMHGLVDTHAIYFTRIYELRGSSYMSEDYTQFDKEDGPIIIKNLMAKYTEAGSARSYTIDGFIKENPLLLYWSVSVMNEVIEEDVIDYICYEINCSIHDKEAFAVFITSKELIKTDYDDVYSWHTSGSKRAEVVVEQKKVYIECATERDFELIQELINVRNTGLVVLETKLTHLDELFDS
jgi:hypothetical protein